MVSMGQLVLVLVLVWLVAVLPEVGGSQWVLAVLGLLVLSWPGQGKGTQEDKGMYPAVCGRDSCPSWLSVRLCGPDWGRGDCAPSQGRLWLLLHARAQQPAETLAVMGL